MNCQPQDRDWIAFDLETTGLLAETDRIVEIGAVRFTASGRELGRFQQLINPGRPMSPSAQAVHGISDAELADSPLANEVLPQFLAFLGDPNRNALIAHNASFDAGFLGRELHRAELPLPRHQIFDSLALARGRLPDLFSHRLETLSRFLGLPTADQHRALADALRVKDLWLQLEGASAPPRFRISFPIRDFSQSDVVPQGWGEIENAIALRLTACIEYEGGSRGSSPREITPKRFVQRGGVCYLVALCHLDRFEKSFRLDRIRRWTIVNGEEASSDHVDAGSLTR